MISTDVPRAARILRQGGIVSIPTETVYGLAAEVHHRGAVERIYAVKHRPLTHPLIIHLSRHDDPSRWGQLDAAAATLADRFWPGPLTLLVRRTDHVPDWVTGGRDTVALRIPDHPLTLELLEMLDDALVAPSANTFGSVSPTRAEHVERDLGSEIDLVLDGGPCPIGVESTIIECIGHDLRILRFGAVTEELIAEATGTRPDPPAGPSRAPGMMASHYAPRARVVVCESPDEGAGLVDSVHAEGGSAALVWDPDSARYAATLYERLRAADDDGIAVIVAVLPPPVGIGAAVRDRLMKAAAAG